MAVKVAAVAVHVEALRHLQGVDLIAVMGSSREKSRQKALQLDVPKHYADYDELLRDPEIESVHICTPKKMHYEMTRNALLAGNHVVCEKPLTVSIEEAEELKGRILPERNLPGSGK